jgi:hypothetical protein
MARRIEMKRSAIGSNLEARRPTDRSAASRLSHGGNVEQPLATIVEYTDQKPAKNQFPERIVSPVRSGPCCFTDMEEIGTPQEDGRWVFQYKRCKKCGFSLRVILREIPDAALASELRKILANSFVRNVPE